MLSGDYFKKAVHGRDTANYKVVSRSQVAYATIHLDEGSIGIQRVADAGLVSPMYTVFEVDESTDPDFLIAVMKLDKTLNVYKRLAQGTVNRRASISFQKLAGLYLACPPLSEQRKITAILASIDDVINGANAVIGRLRDLRGELLREMFPEIDGRDPHPLEGTSGSRVLLRDLARVVRGSSPRPAGDPKFFNGDFVPWLTVGEITKDDWPYLDGTNLGLTKEGAERSRLLPSGTVVLTNSGATLGAPKILKIDTCANDGVAAFLELRNEVEPLFLYYFLLSKTKAFRQSVARGVGQPNLNTDLIGDIPIRITDLGEQARIATVLFSIDDRIRLEVACLEEKLALKSALSSVLLTGELRVAPDEAVA